MSTKPYKNALLSGLDDEVVAGLDLHPVSFTRGDLFEHFCEPIPGLMFVEQGLAVMSLPNPDGQAARVGVIGDRGATGVFALLKDAHSAYETFILIEGHGYIAPISTALTSFHSVKAFRTTMLAYAGDQFVDAVRMASCNAIHEIPARLASFLLLCAERSHQTTLPFTQEALARLLSVQRSSVSLVASRLKREGLITFKRGGIQILDRKALQATACDCYESYQRS